MKSLVNYPVLNTKFSEREAVSMKDTVLLVASAILMFYNEPHLYWVFANDGNPPKRFC